MFPLLPILILLFMGPANADPLAAEGRLSQAILAVHLAHSTPAKACVATLAEEAKVVATHVAKRPTESLEVRRPLWRAAVQVDLACPPRAGP